MDYMLDPPEDEEYYDDRREEFEDFDPDDFPDFYLYESADNASSLWQSGRNI